MRTIVASLVVALLLSCNVSVDKQTDKDSTSKFDSAVQKVDDKLEEWGDTAKAKFKDIKEDVKDRLKKDSSGHRKD